MRRLLYWLFILAFASFIVRYRHEVWAVLLTFGQGSLGWLLVAALFELGHYWLYSLLYQTAFKIVGFPVSVREIFPFVISALAVNVVTPSAGTSTALLFMDYAAQRNHAPGKISVGSLLVLLTRLAALASIVIAAFYYLSQIGHLEHYQVAGGGLLIVSVAGFGSLMALGLLWPAGFKYLFLGVRYVINSVAALFGRPDLVTEKWIYENSAAFTSAARAVVQQPNLFGRMIAISFIMHLVDLTCLAIVFRAFHQPISFQFLASTYAIGQLFWVVSPAPQGIGVVEGVMAYMYSRFHVDLNLATTIVLAFRGLSFWIPLAIGFILLRYNKSFHNRT